MPRRLGRQVELPAMAQHLQTNDGMRSNVNADDLVGRSRELLAQVARERQKLRETVARWRKARLELRPPDVADPPRPQ